MADSANAQQLFHLFIKGDEKSILAYFKTSKGKVKYRSGDRYAVSVPFSEMDQFCAQSFITWLHFENYKPFVLNDTMRLRNNVDSAHSGHAPLESAYSGKGVIVAIIDTGIDFLHPDFLDSAGNTRILNIWDQTAPYDAQRTPGYGYGQVWDSSSINSGACTQLDTYAHGSTVAGTSAGNGRATGQHKGIAHDAVIVGVKSNLNAMNWLGTMADAVHWICHISDSLGLPVVINASLGVYEGSHDGRDPSAQIIDSLLRAKRGRLMVCAAGNSGDASLYGNYHLRTEVDADTSFTWFSYNPGSALGYGSVFFEVWADTADFNAVQFAVGADAYTPAYSFRGNTNFRTIQQVMTGTVSDTLYHSGNRLAIVDYYGALMGDVYYMQVHLKQPDSSQYHFRFMSTGNGAFDVWSASWMGISNMIESPVPTVSQLPDIVNYVSPDSAKVIVSSFSCLASVLTVANYAGANSYWDYTNTLQTFPYATHQISVNSSRGPTRDNRIKPELAASGDVTMSAGPLSSLAWMRINEPYKVSQDSMHMRNGGTSMASPVVAGIGALLLEKCPELNSDDFATAMIVSANQDAFTQNVPNITWGYGKVNAFRALYATAFTPLIYGDSTFCFGDSTLLSSDLYSSYLWNGTSSSADLSVSQTTGATLITTNAAGCKSDTAFLQVNEWPQTPEPDLLVVPTGNFSEFSFFSNATGANFQWTVIVPNDTLIAGNGNPFLYLANEHFHVFLTLTDANGCLVNSDTLFILLENIQEQQEGGFRLYPNPSSGEIEIETIHNYRSPSYVQVYDMQGKKCAETVTDRFPFRFKLDLPNGVYTVELRSENQIYHQKLILVK